MSTLENIQAEVEAGRPRYMERLICQALEEGVAAERILEEALVPAMRAAGEYYKNNEGDIPRILAAARCMRKGLDLLEPYLEQGPSRHLGKVILGTVEGDLHDVGKNLVAIMFRSAGFQVIDLGVDVSEKEFLKAVREHPDVSIVCLSSLLTTSKNEMRQVVSSLRRLPGQRRLKIMVGGGSITQDFADEIGADAYTETAIDAAERAKTFIV